MSLYSQYIKERAGKDCIEINTGFAVYSILGEYCYLEDIFIQLEYRKQGYAAILADKVTAIAKEKGCQYLVGSVSPTASGSTESLKALLAYGMKLVKSDTQLIWFEKRIK